jgi:hypothetical protein
MHTPQDVRPTPEFVRWALARPCPLREFEGWDDPEQVERRLRPLRKFAEAAGQGRLFEGICVGPEVSAGAANWSQATGFRASEVLNAYGGHEYVRELCGDCPGNALRGQMPQPLAGCYGELEFSGLDRLQKDLESVAAGATLREALEKEFVLTVPRWYGLWIESPLRSGQLECLNKLLAGLAALDEAYRERLGAFLAATGAAAASGLPLHVTLVPRGEYTATHWSTVSHCLRCKAPWPSGPRKCAACGLAGRPRPGRKRHARGQRPYWRLSGFLGAENVGPFLQRYFDGNRTYYYLTNQIVSNDGSKA